MNKKIMSLVFACLVLCLGGVFAQDNSDFSVDIRSLMQKKQADMPVPSPSPAPIVAPADAGKWFELNGGRTLACAVRIPYSLVDSKFKEALNGKESASIADPARPVFFKQGEYIYLSNFNVRLMGLPVFQPTIKARPFLAAKNKIGFQVVATSYGNLPANTVMAAVGILGFASDKLLLKNVADTIISAVKNCLVSCLSFLSQGRPQQTAAAQPDKGVADFYYDENAKIFYVTLTDKFISAVIPGQEITEFVCGDADFILSVGEASTNAIIGNAPYNIMLGDGNVNRLLRSVSSDNLSFVPDARIPGGIRFGNPDETSLTVSGMVNTGITLGWPYKGKKLKIAFTALLKPSMPETNRVVMEIDRIRINNIIAGNVVLLGIPDFIQNIRGLQNILIDRTTKFLAGNPGIKRFVGVTKTGPASLAVDIKAGCLLPAFFDRIDLNAVKLSPGKLYVRYQTR